MCFLRHGAGSNEACRCRLQSHAGLANLTGDVPQRLGVRALGHRDLMGQVLIRLRNGVLSLVAVLLLGGGAAAQEGCYFGVCPGDPGTEFPTTPTVQLPPSVSLPAPVPTSRSVMTSSVGAGPSRKSISGLVLLKSLMSTS